MTTPTTTPNTRRVFFNAEVRLLDRMMRDLATIPADARVRVLNYLQALVTTLPDAAASGDEVEAVEDLPMFPGREQRGQANAS